ncbi:MAG: M23 family metallopeptidase [Bacteroidales bacterium]|nr:M23 family metallopeptidase [Bacteroidales bacterium]
MPKKNHTYRWNPHTLSFEKVRISFKDKLKKISFSVALGIVLGVTLLVIGFQVFDSPKERQLKRQLNLYARQMETIQDILERDEAVLADLENRDNSIYRTLLEAEPISHELRQSGIPVYGQYDYLQGYDNSKLIIETQKKLDDFSKRLYVQSKSFDEVYKMVTNRNERQDHTPCIMPLDKRTCKLMSGFGARYHPILHYRRMHTGVDLSAKKGTPIYATADGTVEVAGRNESGLAGYGISVLINHGYGYKTLYAHMNDVKVRPGQKVKRGELIGHVGNSGLSSGPHCHYEVWLNGKKVDPVYYFYNDLSSEEYEQVIEAAKQENQCLS